MSENEPITTAQNSHQETPAPLFFMRIAVRFAAFATYKITDEYLSWGYEILTVIALILVSWGIENLLSKWFDSTHEARLAYWIRAQIPWVVTAILIYMIVNRYLYDLHHP